MKTYNDFHVFEITLKLFICLYVENIYSQLLSEICKSRQNSYCLKHCCSYTNTTENRLEVLLDHGFFDDTNTVFAESAESDRNFLFNISSLRVQLIYKLIFREF